MTTPLLLCRIKELHLSILELKHITIGTLFDMFEEQIIDDIYQNGNTDYMLVNQSDELITEALNRFF